MACFLRFVLTPSVDSAKADLLEDLNNELNQWFKTHNQICLLTYLLKGQLRLVFPPTPCFLVTVQPAPHPRGTPR